MRALSSISFLGRFDGGGVAGAALECAAQKGYKGKGRLIVVQGFRTVLNIPRNNHRRDLLRSTFLTPPPVTENPFMNSGASWNRATVDMEYVSQIRSSNA